MLAEIIFVDALEVQKGEVPVRFDVFAIPVI